MHDLWVLVWVGYLWSIVPGSEQFPTKHMEELVV